MSWYAAAQKKVLAVLQKRADGNGEIRGLSLRAIEKLAKVPWSTASKVVEYLIADGKLTRISRGRGKWTAAYRLGGTPKPPEPPAPKPIPSSIETVTRIVKNHDYRGLKDQPTVRITLPRLRCLETGAEQ